MRRERALRVQDYATRESFETLNLAGTSDFGFTTTAASSILIDQSWMRTTTGVGDRLAPDSTSVPTSLVAQAS
jgi:hypothetical protein